MTRFKVRYSLAGAAAGQAVHVVEAEDEHGAAAAIYPVANERESVEVEEVPDDFELERED